MAERTHHRVIDLAMTAEPTELRVSACNDETVYETVDDAIAAVRQQERAELAAAHTASLKQCVIDAASWTDSTLAIYLSNRKRLLFSIENTSIIWKLDEVTPQHAIAASEAASVVLRYVNTDRRMHWRRTALIKSRIGKEFKLLFPATSWVYVYVADSPILRLSRLVNLDSNQSRLYWDETS
jgi:hypothetical protein